MAGNTELRGDWSVQHTPGTAAQATITKAAVAGSQHVCTGVSATLSAAATASGIVIVNLRDGASGAGTILGSWGLSCPVQGSALIFLAPLNIPGTVGNAMTLEFAGAGAAATQENVTLMGYSK